jgi:hypothetical protein
MAISDRSTNPVKANLSRSISLSLFDATGREIPVQLPSQNDTIELFIPRDPNYHLPAMTRQNLSSFRHTSHRLLFNLHAIELPSSTLNHTFALHFELQPVNHTAGFLLVYRFDQSPQLDSSIRLLDGWSCLCPSATALSTDQQHTYLINNIHSQHRSIIVGIRQLNETEIEQYCSNMHITSMPPISDQPFNFTDDYAVRSFLSACYYFDLNNRSWHSHGLIVRLHIDCVLILHHPTLSDRFSYSR